MTTRFQVVNEITLDPPGNWQLCLQWGRYVEDGGEIYEGHRFIYRRPNGSLQPARAQARILDLHTADALINAARAAGWGNNVATY